MRTLSLTLAALACLGLIVPAVAADTAPAPAVSPVTDPAALKKDVAELVAKAESWLWTQQQANGAFAPGAKFAIGITALAVDALASEPTTKNDPRLAKAVQFLLANQQADGGIYAADEGLGNYGTALSLMAFASTGLASQEQISRAQQYLFGLQNTDAASIASGGIGYGSKGKGHEDLSNTAMAVEGLRRSGVPAGDPHMKKALEFIERCQNLSSHNKLPWVNNDGGAVYSPEESKASGSWAPEAKPGDPVPKLESYGGMTYQLISSYAALDLKPGDPRVDAAMAWAKKNYRFDANPGMQPGKERQGLFYYYMAMAKTFDLLDQTALVLPDGRTVDWRADLFQAIKKEAAALPDGKPGVVWINSADRWAEGMPQVTGGYLIKALKRIHASL